MSDTNNNNSPVPVPAPVDPLWKRLLARVSGRWVQYLILLVAGALLARLGVVLPPVPQPDGPIFFQGWIEDHDAVDQVQRGQVFKSFSDTEAGKIVLGDEDAFLWKSWEKVLGKLPDPRNQRQVGSCVGFGFTSAASCLLAVQIANGNPQEYHDLVEEITYAGSRVEVGGGRIRGDGSVGAWAARFVRDWGVLPRKVIGNYDLRIYSEARCREWGRAGVPDDLEPLAKLQPVKEVVLVRNAEEARKSLQQGYPIAVCSNQGFSQQRDAQGFARGSGSWAHCMCIIGYQGGNRRGFFVWNSWGATYSRGPLGKGNPPEGGFWAEWDVVDRMLRQGDSWALSDVQGFPSRKLDWLLKNDQPQKGAEKWFASR